MAEPTSTPGARRANMFPFQDRIRTVDTDQPWQWLAAGWRDLRAGGLASMLPAVLIVLFGYAATVMLYQLDMVYLIWPTTAGFFLVAPALAVGFYAISRKLSRGEKVGLFDGICAWCRNPSRVLGFGLALVFFMILWLRVAALIYVLSFSYHLPTVEELLTTTLFTYDGLVFLAVGTLIGAGLAFVAFLATVVSLQALLDGRTDFLPAILISVFCVAANRRAMALWAAIIVVVTGAGIATGFVGLIVTLPLIGHASWHAYVACIRPPEA